MNIQIFGTKKCNDTKKVERFFKESGIKYQFIDMKEKGLHDPLFLAQKSVDATEADKQIVTDLLDTLRANLEH